MQKPPSDDLSATSVRVTRRTLELLQRLAREVGDMWRLEAQVNPALISPQDPSLDVLIRWLAAGGSAAEVRRRLRKAEHALGAREKRKKPPTRLPPPPPS